MNLFPRPTVCASILACMVTIGSSLSSAQTPDSLPILQLEAKIPLGDVRGRIDHMAIDPSRNRLAVAELGNDSVGIVDLIERRVVRVIGGLSEPQGVAYVPSSDMFYVSNAGNGMVSVFRASDYAPAGYIDLGDDADNIRLDVAASRIIVGYGNGGLAVINPANRNKVADIPLKAHPESFQLDRASSRAFVNVPKAGEIAIVDLAAGRQVAAWPMRNGGNFPMALDLEAQRVVVVFRNPPQLGVFSMLDGAVVAQVETCGDADDVFLDPKRHRVYVACGEGFLDVFDAQAGTYRRLARVPTVAGARTALFVPEMDRLFLAARATTSEPASIWVFRPTP